MPCEYVILKGYNCILFVYLVCADIDQELKTVKQNYGISIGVVVLVAVSSICGICCYIIKRNKYQCSSYKKFPGKSQQELSDQSHESSAASANKSDTKKHDKPEQC